jgi:hypothetical protein
LNLLWALALLLLLAAAAGSIVIVRRGAGRELPRGVEVALTFCAAILLWMTTVWVLITPYGEWNGARVAPVLAWTMGMPLYFPPGNGPASAFMYPPVSAILRLPVAFTSTPNSAILLSAVINALTFFLPLVVYIRCVRGRRSLRWLALLVAWGMTLNVRSLHYSAFEVHADAAAVGFALLACACLTRWRCRISTRMLMLSSACAVLAIGSKQTIAPILLMLPVFAGLRHGIRAAVVLGIAELVMVMAAVALAIGVFGYEPLRYNLWDLAVRQPWWFEELGVPGCLVLWSGTLIDDSALPAVAIVMILVLAPSRASTWRKWIHRNPWLLPLALAIALVPVSIVGVAKRGGQQNALTLTTYFLAAALAEMILRLKPRRQRRLIQASAATAISLAILAVCPFTQKLQIVRELAHLQATPQMQAYRFAALHPGEVYFPRQPLAGLLVDGKYYLFEYGWDDQIAAGKSPDLARMSQWLPSRMQMIAFPPTVGDLPGHLEIPGFDQQVEVPQLPGWLVLTRPERSYSAPQSP